MMNVIGTPVYNTPSVTNPKINSVSDTSPASYTTSDTNPEKSVTTKPPKYFDPATETVNIAFANTTKITQKGISLYFLLL